jgi:hypothetical protein
VRERGATRPVCVVLKRGGRCVRLYRHSVRGAHASSFLLSCTLSKSAGLSSCTLRVIVDPVGATDTQHVACARQCTQDAVVAVDHGTCSALMNCTTHVQCKRSTASVSSHTQLMNKQITLCFGCFEDLHFSHLLPPILTPDSPHTLAVG